MNAGVVKSNGYYSGDGAWVSSSSYYSVTIAVNPGDRIDSNGFSVSGGIVCAFFYGDTYITGVSKANANTAYLAHGYLTVPQGVNAMNIVMRKSAASRLLYIDTLPTRIASVDLTVNAPATGAAPVTTISGTNYTGTISWTPVVDGKFVEATAYTATVTLTAAEGYKFQAQTAATLNGETVTAQRGADGKLTVTYEFPATQTPDEVLGDISGDGTIEPEDYTILNRYLAGWNGYEEQIVSMDAADINKDGKVSTADATILARYLAGWDGYAEYFE